MVLREFIRRVLNEAAFGINDIPEGHIIVIKSLGAADTVIKLVDLRADPASSRPLGEIGIHKPDTADGPCDGAWVVATSHAVKGWGPVLYDLAIEYATQNANGLVPDRATVSSGALRVWNHYMNQRPDVQAFQLDDMRNTLTPVNRDNAEQESAVDDAYSTADREKLVNNPKAFTMSSLSKRYTKKPVTINALKDARKLRIE